MRWDGARQPTIWTVPAPEIDPWEARLELARRYLHVFGPTTATAFGVWAGIRPARARAAFEALAPSLTPVRTPVGDGWVLAVDEPMLRAPQSAATRPGSCRAATPTRSSRARTASCSCRTPTVAPRCGPRASGRAPSSSGASWSGRGSGRRGMSRCGHGAGSRVPSAQRSSRRRSHCRSQGRGTDRRCVEGRHRLRSRGRVMAQDDVQRGY